LLTEQPLQEPQRALHQLSGLCRQSEPRRESSELRPVLAPILEPLAPHQVRPACPVSGPFPDAAAASAAVAAAWACRLRPPAQCRKSGRTWAGFQGGQAGDRECREFRRQAARG
jgi:hypothetical protein